MSLEKIPSRQLGAWLSAALIPVLIQLLGGTSWLNVGVAGILCGLLVWIVWRWGAPEKGRWLCLAESLYIIVLLGELAPCAAQCWSGSSYPAVPLVLLALAAWSANKGASAAGRVGCVLFWFVLIMYLTVFGVAAKEVNVRWLMPPGGGWSWKGTVLLLIPAAANVLRKEGRWMPRLVLPALLCLIAAALTAGVLSAPVAAGTENAFYEMSRSLNLLGIAERFEAVISAGATVGWFSLMSLLLSVAAQLAETLHAGWGRAGVAVTAAGAAAWMLCGLHISEPVLAGMAAVFWVALPILTQGIEKIKKT